MNPTAAHAACSTAAARSARCPAGTTTGYLAEAEEAVAAAC
ncbi:hypothetical protein ACFYQA_39015 [Streptomyces sp. NPDC005774]